MKTDWWDDGAGISKRFAREDGQNHVEQVQDVQDIVNWNKAMQDARWDRPKNMLGRHLYRVPTSVWTQWLKDDAIPPRVAMQWNKKENAEYVRKKMADHEYQAFKVTPTGESRLWGVKAGDVPII